MSFSKIVLAILFIIILFWLISIPILKMIAHISNLIEIKKFYGTRESLKYFAFVIFQGILALLGMIVIGWLIRSVV